MSATIALAIPHTPWKTERIESYTRLRHELGLHIGLEGMETGFDDGFLESVRIFTDRCANWEWSHAMWTWGVETDASHFLTLQDDVLVSPHFWPELRAMLEAYPDAVIGLESVHVECKAALERGDRWITTSDGLIGVGYVLPTAKLRAFLEWRSSALCKGAVESVTEDTLLCLWCLVTGERIYHPVPTIIDHDTSLASTYGNDKHDFRRPEVTWKEVAPGETCEWWTRGQVLHAGRFYESTPRLARRWVKGATDEDWERWMKS